MAKIFLSYCHADENYCDMLKKHLSALERQGLVKTWHDREIKAGDVFENSIDQQLNEANIILLLVSSDFIASKYCYEIEMIRAMERHAAGEAKVIPIILRPCDWSGAPFSKLLAAPKDGKAVKSWHDEDEAFLDIVRQVKGVISERSNQELSTKLGDRSSTEQNAVVATRAKSSNLAVRKTFTQAEKDDFLDQAFGFMAHFFENSLAELEKHNPQLSTRYRKVDANRFTAIIYSEGAPVSRCKIVQGGMFGNSITYAANDQASDNMCNESLSVECDDRDMFLRNLGMRVRDGGGKLSLEQAAELYWSILLEPLQ